MEESEDWIFDAEFSLDEDRRDYHLRLLGDMRLVHFEGHGCRLTAQGHDFLGAVRDDGIWKKTKNAVAETGGSATLEIVKAIALGFLKKKLSKHTGFEL